MAKKKNGGDFFNRVEAFEKKHDKTPAQRQARQNQYVRRQARTPVFRNDVEKKVYTTAHKAYRHAVNAIRDAERKNVNSPEYKYRQKLMNRNDTASKIGRGIIRKLSKSSIGSGVLGATHGLASGVTLNAGDFAAKAAGYKDYDDYHRAHTKYHALTKKQEEKLKSSKAYKVGETVGDIASYFVGYGGAAKALGKGAEKLVGKKLVAKGIESAAESGAKALGKGAVKRAVKKEAVKTAERAAEKGAVRTAERTAVKSAGKAVSKNSGKIGEKVVGKAIARTAKADVRKELKAAAEAAGKKMSRKELSEQAAKKIAKMSGSEVRKYTKGASERIAKNVAKDVLGDVTVGAVMDTSHELKNGVKPIKEGKDGKLYVNGKFVRDMAGNAATNLVAGGAMDTVPGMIGGLRGSKGSTKLVRRLGADGKIHTVKVAADEGEEALTHAKESAKYSELGKRGAETKSRNKLQKKIAEREEREAVNKYSDFQKSKKNDFDRLEELRKRASGEGVRAGENGKLKASEAQKEYDNLRNRLMAERDRAVADTERNRQRQKFAQIPANKENFKQTVHSQESASKMLHDENFVKYMKDNGITASTVNERAVKNGTKPIEEFRKVRDEYNAKLAEKADIAPEKAVKENASDIKASSDNIKVAAAKVEKPMYSVSKKVDDNLSDIARGYMSENHMKADDVWKRPSGWTDEDYAGAVSEKIESRLLSDAKNDPDKLDELATRYESLGKADREAYKSIPADDNTRLVAEESGEVNNSVKRVPTGEKVTLDNGKVVDVYEGVDVTRGGERGVGGSQGTFKGHASDMKKNIKRWQNLSKEDEAAVKSYLDGHYGEKSQMSVKELKTSFENEMNDNGPEYIMNNIRKVINENAQFSQRDIYYASRMCQYAQKALEETGDSVYAKMLAESRTALSIGGSEAGKALQAIQNFYKNSPEGRRVTIEAAINRLGNQYKILDLSQRIDKKLIDAVSNAEGKDALEIANKNLRDAIWSNIPATMRDKVDAWRYTAMLSSPKTHVRNIAGNAIMLPLRGARNLVEQPIEKALGGRLEARTKAFVRLGSEEGKEYLKVAKEVADGGVIKDIMNGSTKYGVDDGKASLEFLSKPENRSNFNHPLAQKVFRGLEKFQRFVGWSLEKEDELFIRYNFYTQFASYCKRNGIKASDFKKLSELEKSKVIDYASNEALVATYREDNAVAAWISRQRNEFAKSNSIAAKTGKLLLDSAVPFSKTPINILKTSSDFSPVGLFTGIRNIIKSKGDTKQLENALKQLAGFPEGAIPKQTKELIYKTCKNDDLAKRLIEGVENLDPVKMRSVLNDPDYKALMEKAKISGTDQKMLRKGIDQLASGIVGTPILLAGFLMGMNGSAQGVFDQQSRLDQYKKSQGEQEYSFIIDGKSYTYNWAAPLAMTFAIGVNAGNAAYGDPYGIAKGLALTSAWAKAASSALDPVTTMSVLSGVQNVFSTNYSNSSSTITAVGKNMAENYLSQFIPTLGGQIAQSLFTDKQLSTAATNADATVRGYVNTFNYWKSRIPLLNRTLPTSYDVYGRSTDSPNMFNAFIAPYNKKDVRANAVDSEVRSLYKRTGDDSVLPKNVTSTEMNNFTFNAGGIPYHMSQDDFAEYKRVLGRAILNGLDKLFNSDAYKNMSVNDKKDAIGDIYSAAKEKAQKNFLMSKGVSETDYDFEYSLTSTQRQKYKAAKKAGVSKSEFVKYKMLSKGHGNGDSLQKANYAMKAGADSYKEANAMVGGRYGLSKAAWKAAKRMKTDPQYRRYYNDVHNLEKKSTESKLYLALKNGAKTPAEAAGLMGVKKSYIYKSTWNKIVDAYNNGVSVKFINKTLNEDNYSHMKKSPDDRYRDPEKTYQWVLNHYKTTKERRAAWNLLKYNYRTWYGYGF